MALSKGSWSPTSGMKENWLVQVYETDASGFKSFSFYDQTVNSVAYSGIILNNPSIRESINVFRSTSSISNLSIQLQDNSDLRQIEVPIGTLERAENYWRNVNEEHKMGLPQFKLGASPVEQWNCSYCPYYDHCEPPYIKRK